MIQVVKQRTVISFLLLDGKIDCFHSHCWKTIDQNHCPTFVSNFFYSFLAMLVIPYCESSKNILENSLNNSFSINQIKFKNRNQMQKKKNFDQYSRISGRISIFHLVLLLEFMQFAFYAKFIMIIYR